MKPHFYWFAPTNGDGRYLGLKQPEREPTFEYLVDVAQTAEKAGFEGILIPTGIPYLDSWLVGSAIIHKTKYIKPLIAFRPGFVSPTVASKMAATLDQFSKGRVLVNVVTGGSEKELAQDGDYLSHQQRYERTDEFLTVVKETWRGESFHHDGEFFNVTEGKLIPTLYQEKGIPIYFGGSSDVAKEIAAKAADVYLQWGEPIASIQEQIQDVENRAKKYNRQLEYGIRIHIVVRDTEQEAWDAAYNIISKIENPVQSNLNRYYETVDSVAQKRMNVLTAENERFDQYSWAGIGKIRKGAGTAIVGTPEQVKAGLQAYIDIGVTHFILSGFPHKEEAEIFGEKVLPLFE